jgi:hypothetical protein
LIESGGFVRYNVRHFLPALLLAVGVVSNLWAQQLTGDIVGTATDRHGNVISGASIKLENLDTHESREIVTGTSGAFAINLLQAGNYRASITDSGFKTLVYPRFTILAGDHLRVDALLDRGSSTEIVTAASAPSALQKESTSVGGSIAAKVVTEVPTNAPNPYLVAQVAPGVNPGSYHSLQLGSKQVDRRQSASLSTNGQSEFFNNNLIDGMDNNERWDGLTYLRLPPDAIQSVRIDTSSYAAELSRTAGAVVNILTKSGTNDFHGSLYEFLRNNITDARNFFSRPNILPSPPKYIQNVFGGTFGGPIIRNKTFFFVDLLEFRQVNGIGTVYTSTVPTLYEEQHPGDLSDIGGPIIPSSSIDPTALAYFKLYPAPNQPGTVGNNGVPANNFLYNPNRIQNFMQGNIRVDHRFNASNMFFARYSYNTTSTYLPDPLPSVGGIYAGGTIGGTYPGNSLTVTHNGLLNYSHIFTPSLTLTLLAAYTLFEDTSTSANYGKNLNNTSEFSIPGANSCPVCSGMTAVTPAPGYAPLGDALTLPLFLTENTFQYAINMTYTHGSHTFKVGGDLTRRQVNPYEQNNAVGSLTFQGSPQTALAAFFEGKPFNYIRQNLLYKPYLRTWEPNAFAQDNWRATRNLTFNMGIRYDIFSAPSETNGRNSLINLATGRLVTGSTAGVSTDYSNIAPRFGFAATLTPNTVLRGGYGLTFFASDVQNAFQAPNPPNSYSSGTVTLNTPISAGIAPSATPSTTSLSGQVTAKPFDFRDAYVEQFNLLLQHDFNGNLLSVAYVGSLGRHLLSEIPNLDVPPPSGSSSVPATSYSAILPQVNTVDFWGDFGSSSYNSLQLSLQRRFKQGLTFNFNYVYAHALDDVNDASDGEAGYGIQPTIVSSYDYGNGYLDIRHRIATTANYQLPFGAHSPRWVKNIVGGWQMNALSFWQTGLPFSITSAVTQTTNSTGKALAYTNLNFLTVDRPNRINNPTLSNPGINRFFDVAAFARQPIGTAGNAGRNILHGPHLRRADISLFKVFPIDKRVTGEFRVEALNFTNTPDFDMPNGQITGYEENGNGQYVATNTGGFGTITSTTPSSFAREFQFVFKVRF